MLSLMARLGLDSSQFHRALAAVGPAAKKAGEAAGKRLGQEFTGALKRTLSFGAITGMAMAAVRIGTEAAELTRTAGGLGVSPQRLAAMDEVSRRLGPSGDVTEKEFNRLTDELLSSGQIAGDNTFKVISRDVEEATSRIGRFKKVVMDAWAVASPARRGIGQSLDYMMPPLPWTGTAPDAPLTMRERLEQIRKEAGAPAPAGGVPGITGLPSARPKTQFLEGGGGDGAAAALRPLQNSINQTSGEIRKLHDTIKKRL